ncbi:MAG: type I-PGING CRISPR-associated protein Cas5p [Bacteroidetes bacterium]|nr:type I-PGING CRISPR-associated protein Cas5p [Bacteroidota bacterium]MCB0538259.1 type I-PGING CRISPR-associated protein Cas5p [Bacteroidota bacterium]
MLKIRPLSPLSMVSSIPGSFYRSNSEPTNTMVYGMLENMMGWHYSDQIRISLKKYLQKQFKKEKRSFSEESAESGYTPLIQNFISIEKLFVRPTSKSFNDLWTQHQKHNDKRHFDGVRNYDWRYTKQINTISEKEKATILKEIGNHFPKYYQSPKKREYVIAYGEYIYEISVLSSFKNELINKINSPVSPPYLGTSEGWVDVKLEML